LLLVVAVVVHILEQAAVLADLEPELLLLL
jgi:hypothetical protein